MMEKIEIRKISITRLDTDAIVNAANEGLRAGGGVCGAIFNEAGHSRLQKACDEIGHCDTGSAVITPGFDLKAEYIIHAVGPVWRGGTYNEEKLLYSAYRESLKLAVKAGCRSVAFPLISAGIFGYPIKEAWETAVAACRDYLEQYPDAGLSIIFAVLDDEILKTGQGVLETASESGTPAVKKSDWKALDMPEENAKFILYRPFSDQQMNTLRKGHIPEAMEDKWFWYMEGETLSAHRSWTGYCIYRMEFKPDNKHFVTVNMNTEQTGFGSMEEAAKGLNDLLNWWVQDHYDYYSEWLSETVQGLEKAGKLKEKLKINGNEYDAYYFHKPDGSNGYLSNWFMSAFELEGIRFTSAEQYIMYRKCLLFGDKDAAAAVLAADDPGVQQKIGRKAAGYIEPVWSGARQVIAIQGLYAKFSQNADLKEMLLNTGDAYLVECAVTDTAWACGISIDDDRKCDAANWKGSNILGSALMEVRRLIREGLSVS